MICKYIVRQMHTTVPFWNAQKSMLATLRKKTGYTFANCKKALEIHDNDLLKAEKWLKDQAQTLGWSKATKLQGRQTTQGLIGVLLKNNTAAMVEVNCETDFVARNENFQNMIDNAANACIEYAAKQETRGLNKISLNAEELKNLNAADGKSLSDHLALMIGTVGENATLKRALCFKAVDDIKLSVYTHPSGEVKNGTLLGRFGGVVALKQIEPRNVDIGDLGKKLCQHVVGMDPKKVGTDEDIPEKNLEDEPCLINQEYLHDESLIVKDVLNEYGVDVIDFKRFACGEEISMGLPLDNIETCQ